MNEEQIFSEALQIESASERDQFLRKACSDDEKLRARIQSLLDSHFQAGDFLNRSPVEAYKPTLVPGLSDGSGDGDLEFLKPSLKEGVLSELGGYEVLSIIGRGGLGVVLKARDPALNRVVAIKVPASEYAANAFARQRFAREAQAAAAVAHDHVVTIHAVGEDGSVPYLVMELVDGISLQEKIDETGPLDVLQILRIGTQTARGLAAAHAQGLVHRDIKPANILLEDGQRAKLTDFGLARAVDDVRMTRTGMVAGTPQYMSPEQAHGRQVDHRSDLFSLGSVLYAMCTGRPAFRADSAMAVLKRVCDDEQRPACEVNPTIPEWLSDIVDCLLAKEPGDRIQTAAEVADLLERRLAHVQEPGAVADHPSPLRPRRQSRPAGGMQPGDAARRALKRGILITRLVAASRLTASIWFFFASFMFDSSPDAILPGFLSTVTALDILAMLLCLRRLEHPKTIQARRTAAYLTVFPLSPMGLLCLPLATYATYLLLRKDVAAQFNEAAHRDLWNQTLPPVGGGPKEITVPAGVSVHDFIQDLRGRQELEARGADHDFEPRQATGATGTMTHIGRLYRGRGNAGRSLAIGLALLIFAAAFLFALRSGRHGPEAAVEYGPPKPPATELPEPNPPAFLSLDVVRTLSSQQAQVAAMSVLPDGKSALVVSRDETVRLMDLETGETLQKLHDFDASRQLGPDGKTITIRPGDWPPPEVAVAVSNDGRLGAFAGGRSDVLRIWDLATGNEVARWYLTLTGRNKPAGVAAVQFSPDGTEVLTTTGMRNVLIDGPSIRGVDAIWRIDDLKARVVLPVCSAAAWSPDGSTLLTARSSGLGSELWIGETEQRPLFPEVEEDDKDSRHVSALMWLPDNRKAVVAWTTNEKYSNPEELPPQLVVVDTQTSQVTQVLSVFSDPIEQLTMLPDKDRFLARHSDGTYEVWNLKTAASEGRLQTKVPGADIHISNAGTLITAGRRMKKALKDRHRFDGGVEVYAMPLSWLPQREPQVVYELKSHTAGIQFLSFAPGGRLVSAAKDGQILLWDIDGESVIQNLTPHDGHWGPDMCVSLDDRFATAFGNSGNQERNVRFHQMANRGAHGMVTQLIDSAPEIQFSAATSEFLVPNSRSIDCWEPRSMSRKVIYLDDTAAHIAVSGDGTVAVANLKDGGLVCCSVPAHRILHTIGRPGAVGAIALNSDGSLAITRSPEPFPGIKATRAGTVRVWDVKWRRFHGSLPASDVSALAFAERDQLIVTGSHDHLRYWDAFTRQPYARVGTDATVLATSHDGTLVATGGNKIEDQNCVIRIWRLPELKVGTDDGDVSATTPE